MKKNMKNKNEKSVKKEAPKNGKFEVMQESPVIPDAKQDNKETSDSSESTSSFKHKATKHQSLNINEERR